MEDYNIFGSPERVPKIRNMEELTDISVVKERPDIEDAEIVIEKPKPKPPKAAKKQAETKDDFDDSMVNTKRLWDKLEDESKTLDDQEDNAAHDTDEGEQADIGDEEGDFFDILVDSPEDVWQFWCDMRALGHNFAYKQYVDKPLNIKQLKELKVELRAKMNAKVITPQETEAYTKIDAYLDKMNELSEEYRKSVEYGNIHHKFGKKWVANKLRKMQMQGKKINGDLLFFFFMISKEAVCMSKLHEITETIPKVEL